MIMFLVLGATALVLTIVVEIIVAGFFGLRNKAEISAVVLINLITNPAMNFVILLNNYFWLKNNTTIFTVCLEIIVVVIEWKLLVYSRRLNNKKSFVLSLSMNAASFLAGLLIFSYFSW